MRVVVKTLYAIAAKFVEPKYWANMAINSPIDASWAGRTSRMVAEICDVFEKFEMGRVSRWLYSHKSSKITSRQSPSNSITGLYPVTNFPYSSTPIPFLTYRHLLHLKRSRTKGL